MPICEIDLRPGGAWRYVWRKGDGSEMIMSGTVTEMAAPSASSTTERGGRNGPRRSTRWCSPSPDGRTTITSRS